MFPQPACICRTVTLCAADPRQVPPRGARVPVCRTVFLAKVRGEVSGSLSC